MRKTDWDGGARLVLLSNYVVLALGTISGILLARALGPSSRGELALVLAWLGIAFVLAEVGQSAAVVFHVARSPKDAMAIRRAGRQVMVGGSLAAGAVLLVVTVVESDNGGIGLFAKGTILWLTFLNAVGAPGLYALQATSLRAWSAARAAQPIVYLSILLALWYVERVTLETVLVGYLAAFGAQMLLANLLARRVPESEVSARRFTRPLFLFGSRTFLGAAPLAILASVDRLVLGSATTLSEVGHYAIALSWVSLVQPFAIAVGSVRFVRIARKGTGPLESNRPGSPRLIIVLGLISSGLCAPLAIPLLFGEEYQDAIALCWWLLPAALFQALNQLSSDELRGHGRPGLVACGQWTGLIVFGVCAPLVVVFGTPGVAVAAGIGQGAIFLVLYRAKLRTG